MLRQRVIPVLLYRAGGLYKSVKFANLKYVGDPLNVIKIFNEKEVDELIFLDIDASKHKQEPDYAMIQAIASECFMPVCYGGGINSLEQIKKIFSSGIEKIAINHHCLHDMNLIREASSLYGSQSIVGAMDVRKNMIGKYLIYNHTNSKTTAMEATEYAQQLEQAGVGEIFVNAVDNDGTMSGYDLTLMSRITASVSVPVIACGGAGNLQHIAEVIHKTGVSAAAAGSMFVFQGIHRAVLITYPGYKELTKILL